MNHGTRLLLLAYWPLTVAGFEAIAAGALTVRMLGGGALMLAATVRALATHSLPPGVRTAADRFWRGAAGRQ